MAELYNTEFRFERRHKQPFAKFDEAPGDAFFDVVGGRYPADGPLRYIAESYDEVFSPETLPADASTALRQVKEGLFGPLWITCHELNESLGRGFRDETFYVFDPTDPGDVIDYWNFRLVQQRVIPINVNWFAEFGSFMRDHIAAVHRPNPGNPFGTRFHSSVCFASSISNDRRIELTREHLSGLPDGAFYAARDPVFWGPQGRGRERRETKILATGRPVSFDEEAEPETSTKIPAPSPSFLNRSERYRQSHWMNVIVPSNSLRGETPAVVYPTNLWSPDFPRLAMSDRLRVGREGWVVQLKHAIGYSLLSLQTGRDAIIGWFKTYGIEAKPSEEGQIAAQVIAAAGGLLPSGMFADPATLGLLGEMAESHAEVSRGGKKVANSTPDRSKHINTIRQHFDAREKRSFGYWSRLDYFLERSVFRAGVRVQCPICGYRNWMDQNALSYRPTCTRCLNAFPFSQKPADLQKVDWFYRVVGPFAAPDFARGAYSVALTLRTLADPHDTEMTWSTGLSLSELNCMPILSREESLVVSSPARFEAPADGDRGSFVPPPDARAAAVPPGYRVEIVASELTYPTSVAFDDRGNTYIAEAGYAYGDLVAPARILRIGPNGKKTYVATQLQGPVTDIMWHQGHLYISHFRKISRLEPSGRVRDLVTDLPSTGEHQNNQMSVGPDGWIYFGQGTATNSGIVGLDSAIPFLWLTLWPHLHDIPAKDIVLTGETKLTPHVNNVAAKQGQLVSLGPIMGQFLASVVNPKQPGSLLARTGPFQPFGQSGARVIPGQVKANGTILRMSPDGSQLEVYAWGLRNPFGVRWGPDGRLYASDNGYDERGSRPIANAPDNVWLVRQNAWYGWPDYASGIPVTDPRFRSSRGPAPKFLMAQHPPVEQPLLTRPKHAGVTKFDFSRSDRFGFRNQMFLGEVGAGAPITAPGMIPAGHQVVRIDLATGEMAPFFRAKESALGPEGPYRYVVTSAPKRPVDARFSPDGRALYIVDVGAILAAPAGAGPMAMAMPKTGVVWRVVRE
jgi:glucose/arabinose dehydrogenase